MRFSAVLAVISTICLAACSPTPKPAPTAPVQANQAAAQDQATTTDADQTQQARPRRKYMNTGSRLPSESADPSVGAPPAGGLNNSSTNSNSNGPR
jgi:hypothetical protein